MKFKARDKVQVTESFFYDNEDWCQRKGITRNRILVVRRVVVGKPVLECFEALGYWSPDYLKIVESSPNHPLTKIFI